MYYVQVFHSCGDMDIIASPGNMADSIIWIDFGSFLENYFMSFFKKKVLLPLMFLESFS